MTDLFDPVDLGVIACRNRIAMAPCTRCMSPEFIPTDDVVAYYERRAADGLGLIISEGAVISHRGAGHLGVPGIFDDEQVRAWRKVTDAVHAAGGRMVCQIWHVGTMAHPRTTGGVLPETASGLSPEGNISRLRDERGGPIPFGPSEAMSEARILEVVGQYRRAAERSMEAGFDGVEIHGAHGYLIDQFTNLAWNRRDDGWGGQQRTRFAAEVTREVIEAIGAGRTLFRFSPHMSVSRVPWVEAEETFELLLSSLAEVGLRILHASNLDYDEKILRSSPDRAVPDLALHEATRQRWGGQIVGVGDLSPDRARGAIACGEVDMVAFGRGLIANPDLTSRIRDGRQLEEYDAEMLTTLR